MSLFRRILNYGGLITVLFLSTIGSVSASTNAYDSKFVTSITYMNVGSESANLSVQFIDDAGATIDYPILNNDGSARTLAANASASLAVSVLDASITSWAGGAIINANQPLVTTMVQVSTNPTIRVRPVSNGFTANDAGTTLSFPYIAKACGAARITSRINIQNVGSSGNIVTTLRWPNGNIAYTQTDTAVPTGGVISIDMRLITVNAPSSGGYTRPNGCGFEGSATITGPSIVATSFETSTNGRSAAAYEGIVTPGTNFIQIPSALCNVNYGDGAQSSSIVIHNPTTSNATVNVIYRYQIRATNGSLAKLLTKNISKTVPANDTTTVNACSDLPARAVGAAFINTNSTPTLTAINKVTGNGVYAVSPGLPRVADGNSDVVYAPYVRYSTRCFTASPTNSVCRNESRQRTVFSVQNANGSGDIKVRMTLYNSSGAVVGTPYVTNTISPNAKVSISPTDVGAVANRNTRNANNEFGYWVIDGNIVYGGSAKFEALAVDGTTSSTKNIAVTVRVLNSTVLGQTAEDYNAIP
ncbi:MAG: hypothetical protein ACO3F2_08425 [Roseiflexaceae bacterium]